MKTLLLTALLLLSGWNASSQTTPPKTGLSPSLTRSDKVVIPLGQARIIADALVRFEALKPAYVERGRALKLKDAAILEKNMALIAKDTILASYERSLVLSERLRLSSEADRQKWRTKARRRSVTSIVLAAALGGLVYLTVTR